MKQILNYFKEHQEIAIVGLIICVLAMIIIPIPHQLMDVLIGVNIGLTILILMIVLYMQSPLELTSFPSILLVLALFRIGITISSSRLILLNGDAGQIIAAFGEFVVGGNLIVGVIIFSTITLINFIVITKGSERVAEVSARFTLDAMPGKQMSIDSDLKANNITMEEAQQRRNDLNLESKLFGAMDGAMKFVKGDAIASIIDIVINLVGGIVIGTLQHSLSFVDALRTYSILTIGDGLVQQVPALLISLTAGMMITRVGDDTNKENLGNNIINQVFHKPKALFSSAVLFLCMAAVPGMPSTVFLSFFGVMVGLGFALQKKLKLSKANGNMADASQDGKIIEKDNVGELADKDFVSWKLQPLVLKLGAALKDTEYTDLIKNSLIEVRRDILVNLGVEIPQIVMSYDKKLEDYVYQIEVFEVPVSNGRFYPDNILVTNADEEVKQALALKHYVENQVDIGLLTPGMWVDKALSNACDEYGVNYLTIEQFIIMHLSKVIKKHSSEFLGMQEVKNMLDKIEDYQDLIKELLRMLPLNKITEILQRLIIEGIPIRNFKIILDSLLEWAQREKEVVILVEYVRKALGRYITYRYSNGTNIIACFLLDTDIEDMVRDAIRFNEKGSYLALDPSHEAGIANAIQEAFLKHQDLKITPVVLSQMDIRRYIRAIIEKDLPAINVLSIQEVEAYAKINCLGVIELN